MGKIDISLLWGYREGEILQRVFSCLYLNLKTIFLHEKKKKKKEKKEKKLTNWCNALISLLAH